MDAASRCALIVRTGIPVVAIRVQSTAAKNGVVLAFATDAKVLSTGIAVIALLISNTTTLKPAVNTQPFNAAQQLFARPLRITVGD